MINGILWMAFVTAGVAGLAAMVMTQSFLWAFLAYSGAGMAVLGAMLVTDMLFADAPADVAVDDTSIPSTSRG